MNAPPAHKNNFFLYPRSFYNSARHPLKTLEVGGSDRNAQAVPMLLKLGRNWREMGAGSRARTRWLCYWPSLEEVFEFMPCLEAGPSETIYR